MDSKAMTTLVIVIVCVMLLPVAIGIVGGIFGVIGGVLGGIIGLIAGVFGAILGVIASIFGVIFGWGDYNHWNCSFNLFDRNVFTAIALVVVIVLIARSRTSGNRNSGPAAKQ